MTGFWRTVGIGVAIYAALVTVYIAIRLWATRKWRVPHEERGSYVFGHPKPYLRDRTTRRSAVAEQ